MKSIGIENIVCEFCATGSFRTVYFLSLTPIEHEVIDDYAKRFKCNFVVITGFDRDNDLTPWEFETSDGVKHSFAGRADLFLKRLTDEIIPEVEKNDGFENTTNHELIGIELSGLFAFWVWTKSSKFLNVATLSATFSYPGFVEKITEKDVKSHGYVYLSLGDREVGVSNDGDFSENAESTGEILFWLRKNHIKATFEWTRGAFFDALYAKLEKAMLALELYYHEIGGFMPDSKI